MQQILLIGTGRMANAYAPVLKALGVKAVAVGQSAEKAHAFSAATGIEAHGGGFRSYARTHPIPKQVIIAVEADKLASVALESMKSGARKILLEKPGALTMRDLRAIERAAAACGARIWIAYNRRHYASVEALRSRIDADGGPASCYFEFNERVTQKQAIKTIGIGKTVEDNWFIANSTHVVDIAFYLAGAPQSLEAFSAAGPLWAPHPTLFAGSGLTERGVPFAYQSNWELPGPWTVEIATKKATYVLNPLEALRVKKDGALEDIEFDTRLDTTYKPGLFEQTRAFLEGTSVLPTIEEQIAYFGWYEKILG